MSEPYSPEDILAAFDAHPIHKMYALINIGIRDRGERWAKCPNCGDPYEITEEWSNTTICSDKCSSEYIAYINNPEI